MLSKLQHFCNDAIDTLDYSPWLIMIMHSVNSIIIIKYIIIVVNTNKINIFLVITSTILLL